MQFDYVQVFPPIGFARVGNSEREYFIGPESPGRVPDNGGSYKDAQGAVKRQAARFRVYGFDSAGVVTELTIDHPDVATIRWNVSLANRKAEWFAFQGAQVVSEILGGVQTHPVRNPQVVGEERRHLVIGPVESAISGRDQSSEPMVGALRFPEREARDVYLGELRTDEAGRLLVLGGRGASGSVKPENPLNNYANNNYWYDDVGDGPVSVEVTFKDGSKLAGRGTAWVIVTPPHYSPHTKNIVTLHDVISETAVKNGLEWNEAELGPKPTAEVSFTHDIYPVLERLVRYQWVSRRAHRGHAAGKRGDFLNPDTLQQLSDPEVARKVQSPQKRIFARIRNPIVHAPDQSPSSGVLDPRSQDAVNQANLYYMPPLAGDEGDVLHGDPTSWLTVTATQYHKLSLWQEGNFVNDWTGGPLHAPELSELPVSRQPAALTIAALEACQGGAFFPGIEMTSVARFPEFYSEAFRLATHLEPGDVTKWMALPWQADFYECRDHWWPSVRPDDVISADDYEQVASEFANEAEQGRLASLLINRRPWARGVGLGRPSRPGMPLPESKQTPKRYRESCDQQLLRWGSTFLRTLPLAETHELGEVYRARIIQYLGQTILDSSDLTLPPVVPGEDLDAYRKTKVLTVVAAYIKEKLAMPEPREGEALEEYVARVAEYAAGQRVWQGIMDVEWRNRVRHWGKNDHVDKWHRLGFVIPKVNGGETVFIESDRGRFELLPAREAFYYLVNIEQHPEFLPKAKELANEYFRLAVELEPQLRSDTNFDHYAFFKYDAATFRARLEKIYEVERRAGEAYNPVTDANEPLFRTPAQIVERIRQLAPFNQLDGSWLERIAKSGPIEDVRAFLFEIWSDEIGNGDPAQNHANVYTDLMHSAGIYLPPLNSRAYAEHPDLWDASFSSPAYQAAVAIFPETFFPELLGMTLYLEWEAIFLPAMVKLYEYHGYPSLFYKLHVAIDNPIEGHGARARDAVMRYLDHVSSESGEAEMQEHWRRIWTGYLAFKFIGDSDWEYRFTNPPTLYDRMMDLFEQKRHYAQLNHGQRRLGVNLLNDWFDEPGEFLETLRNSDLITAGDANRSRFIELLNQTGPMLKVFSSKERALIRDWINSLPPAPPGDALKPGDEMRALIQELQIRGVGIAEHESYKLAGIWSDPEQENREVEVAKSIRWWFSIGQPERFMAALARTDNGWIVPGNVEGSRLVNELLMGGGKMARFFSLTIPELGDKPARKIVIDWIVAGCPMPEAATGGFTESATPRADVREPGPAASRPAASRARDVAMDEFAPEIVRQSADAIRLNPEQRRGIHPRRYGPGGGAAH